MNRSFQQELAERLLERHSGDLSSLIMLFPSLRARTFFNNALSQLVTKPTWQPKWTTIDTLMESISGLVRGERIRLITELFKIYKKYHPNETIDKFYFWGDMLIADFDMIDKYRVDASQLLRNIEEIKELEVDVSYLTPEQLRIISFWKSIGDNDSLSEQKKRFLHIWRTLPKIYEEYRSQLASLGFAYTGMIYRTAIERIANKEEIKLPKGRFVIAGFNALSTTEKMLFDYLATRGAEFYWDADDYYVNNESHEAGMFMRDNLRSYPPTEPISSNNFRNTDKHIRSIACVSNVVQCKYASQLLDELSKNGPLDKRTAIVLTDENMLIPMLHSLPESVDRVNITMGYPLKITLVHSFIERLLELQAHSRKREQSDAFYHVDVLSILSHPYIVDIDNEKPAAIYNNIVTNRIVSVDSTMFSDNNALSVIFSKKDNWQSIAQYLLDVLSMLLSNRNKLDSMQVDYIQVAYDEIVKLKLSVEKCDTEITSEIFVSVVRRHLQTITIPYEGEPLEGVQIMGILETRNIDFDNVILLSMTDTNFPGNKTGQSSFIPYNLRAAYGLPTPEQHEAMYAYYFYRLIQRAKNVSMLYCSRADEKSTGERSRYIYQLEYESHYPIEKLSIGVDLGVDEVKPIEVVKGEYEQQILNKFLQPDSKKFLSPTALFRYIECPLKFYLHSVAILRPQDEISDTIDALTFGNILHLTMQNLYKKFKNVSNPMDEIKKLRKRNTIEEAVDQTIVNILNIDKKSFSGDTILVKDIIVKYILEGILRYDSLSKGFTINRLEEDVNYTHPISNGRCVNLQGIADRIDIVGDKLQIIDYKSGNTPHLEFYGINKLFNGNASEKISNIFQTLLYSMMLYRQEGTETQPTLYFASKMLSDDYSPKIFNKEKKEYIECYSDYAEEFEKELNIALEELFDYSTAFKQTEDVDTCKYCDFKKICQR